MNRIYIPTSSPGDWRKFLAEPEKQWRSGYSAKELAECWEHSYGFPAGGLGKGSDHVTIIGWNNLG